MRRRFRSPGAEAAEERRQTLRLDDSLAWRFSRRGGDGSRRLHLRRFVLVKVGFRIVTQAALGEMFPPWPQLSANRIMIKGGKLGGLAVEKALHRDVFVQELPDLAVILDATEPFRRNSAHDIHEAAFAETLRPEPPPDTAPGKAAKTKIDEAIVEFFPAVT